MADLMVQATCAMRMPNCLKSLSLSGSDDSIETDVMIRERLGPQQTKVIWGKYTQELVDAYQLWQILIASMK